MHRPLDTASRLTVAVPRTPPGWHGRGPVPSPSATTAPFPSSHISAAARQKVRIIHIRLNLGYFCESPLESSLYLPVKGFLEKLGFEVKGEVCGCDLVALREGEPPLVIIGELKLTFTLDLVLQAVDRSAACDEIWLAVRASRRGRGRERDPRVGKLCRLLGLGLLSVSASGKVEVLVEPVPWRPRRDARRRSRIVDEHRRRQGDPAVGGGTRQPIMTAYRQQALACAAALQWGPARPRELKSNLPDAPKILRTNVYGWFDRVERGVYTLSDGGRAALVRWKTHVPPQRPEDTAAASNGMPAA